MSTLNPYELNREQLAVLNSLTKYPSILTYHQMCPKTHVLLEETTVTFDESDTIEVTEKVDGTNSRIILCSDEHWVVGSRENLLAANNDLICDPTLGIVDTLRESAELVRKLASKCLRDGHITVFYQEVFGGKTHANAKQYGKGMAHRLFDIAIIPFDLIFSKTAAEAAAWRDGGNQEFLTRTMIEMFLMNVQDEGLFTRVPVIEAHRPPTSVSDTHEWLRATCSRTSCVLDDTGLGSAEGVVIRTPNRSKIAKIRHEDYEKTLRRRR